MFFLFVPLSVEREEEGEREREQTKEMDAPAASQGLDESVVVPLSNVFELSGLELKLWE